MALAVDFLPRGAAGVGELVGGDADNGAVLGVEGADRPGEVAVEVVPVPREARGGPEFGARIGAGRVELDVVDGAGEEVENCLGAVRDCGFFWVLLKVRTDSKTPAKSLLIETLCRDEYSCSTISLSS